MQWGEHDGTVDGRRRDDTVLSETVAVSMRNDGSVLVVTRSCELSICAAAGPRSVAVPVAGKSVRATVVAAMVTGICRPPAPDTWLLPLKVMRLPAEVAYKATDPRLHVVTSNDDDANVLDAVKARDLVEDCETLCNVMEQRVH